jgi:hypothetical protein
MQSSIACNSRPTTTTQASASPFGVASDAVVAAGHPPRPMLFPAPGPRPLAPVELPTVRETHLAKKALPARLPTSPQHRNSLKKRSLKRHE